MGKKDSVGQIKKYILLISFLEKKGSVGHVKRLFNPNPLEIPGAESRKHLYLDDKLLTETQMK